MSISDEKTFRNELKKIFKGYRKMTKVIKQKLQALGFVIQEGGKHYKLLFSILGKNYVISISKTPSDHRAGIKIVSSICRQIIPA